MTTTENSVSVGHKADILMRIAKLTQHCAAVTVKIGKDYVLITNCPPRVVEDLTEVVRPLWRVTVADGGLKIDTKGVGY